MDAWIKGELSLLGGALCIKLKLFVIIKKGENVKSRLSIQYILMKTKCNSNDHVKSMEKASSAFNQIKFQALCES
jgi:hypothetical protein